MASAYPRQDRNQSFAGEIMRRLVRLAVVAIFVSGLAAVSARAADVLIFAAASTTTIMNQVANLYRTQGMDGAVGSYASSSTLAKQIANGAPADVFLSANEKWMDYVVDKKAVDASTRRDLLTNHLVLVAPADTKWTLAIKPGFHLADALGGGYLAMGDPDHVPAGIYGRLALTALGVWDSIADHVARAADVRAALALVARGEASSGVVYATDAAITPEVRVVATFPESSHPPITYPIAIVAGRDRPEVRRFYDFLMSDTARAVYARNGFGLAAGAATR